MNCVHKDTPSVNMVEGTTRDIVITVLTDNGTEDDLTGYQASFCMKPQNGSDKLLKECTVDKSEIGIHINAEDTLGLIGSNKYEVRVYKDGNVYSVISGNIEVEKSISPYIDMPEVNKE